MTLDFTDYLSEAEQREIARDAFREAVGAMAQDSLKTIISNAAYEMVFRAVDERMQGGLEAVLAEKVRAQIEDSDLSFQIFRAPDAWNRGPSPAYKALMDAVVANRDALDAAVRASLRTAPRGELLRILADGEFTFKAKA